MWPASPRRCCFCGEVGAASAGFKQGKSQEGFSTQLSPAEIASRAMR